MLILTISKIGAALLLPTKISGFRAVNFMVAAFSENWTLLEPLIRGLKFGGLMNQALKQDNTFRQGRHHVMTAINQILELSLAFEQTSRCLRAANLNDSLVRWHPALYVVPLGAAYLASRQINFLKINKAANFVQENLGHLSLIAMTVATVALFVLGQVALAVTTLLYLTVGLLDRYNFLPESVQKMLHHAHFFIGNSTGLYFGGRFVRLVCTLNLVSEVMKQYFEYRKSIEAKKRLEEEQKEEEEGIKEISLSELEQLDNKTKCSVRKAHVHKDFLPTVSAEVKIEDLLELSEKIDWSEHKGFLKAKLAQDKRWLELGQSEPIEYFKTNLRHFVESITNRNILQGKPSSYDKLVFYCRYIAQELKEKDEMTQANTLGCLGIDAGEYCGAGKFEVAEEQYQSLRDQAEGVSLETRILSCLQRERQRVWQNIYQWAWRTSPFIQFWGYLTDTHAIHNANLFNNLIQAGEKFGIPHESAKNDQSATINPVNHYVALSVIRAVEDYFWIGGEAAEFYFSMQQPQRGEWWTPWKWVHLNIRTVSFSPYDEQEILKSLNETIGSPGMPKGDIHSWWRQWIERQDNLDEATKDQLMDEFSAPPQKDARGRDVLTFNGEPFEIDGQIQPKFFKAMLIEMGILNKPPSLSRGSEQIVDRLEGA